jgi:hypothetical protein
MNLVCPVCGVQATYRVNETIVGGELVWSTSYYCPHCGVAEEADGKEKLPEADRKIAFEHEGVWQLTVPTLFPSPVLAMKAIREVFNLPLQDVQLHTPDPAARGTRTEMIYFQLRLLQVCSDLQTEISRVFET